ncbi:MAG: SdiA-regulated domain-containing protein [Bacteroidota bacterium]
MMKPPTNVYRLAVVCLYLCLISCSAETAHSPDGYNFDTPVKLPVKQALSEISGICFPSGNSNFLYAIEDERGKIYTVDLISGAATDYPFGKKDDYEDLASYQQKLYVLNSRGTINSLTIPTGEAPAFTVLTTFEGIVPAAEYEGMCVANDSLYVLCKESSSVDAKHNLALYPFKIDEAGDLIPGTIIQPVTENIKGGKNNRKQKILPSAIAKNPVTGQWYILSGVNKMLLVYNEQFEFVNNYQLDAGMFGQPEGITFNNKGDLYISNEANGSDANILSFTYQPGK